MGSFTGSSASFLPLASTYLEDGIPHWTSASFLPLASTYLEVWVSGGNLGLFSFLWPLLTLNMVTLTGSSASSPSSVLHYISSFLPLASTYLEYGVPHRILGLFFYLLPLPTIEDGILHWILGLFSSSGLYLP
jgi:hypothetical protein